MFPLRDILQHVFHFLALTSVKSARTPDIKGIFGPVLSTGAEIILRSDTNWTQKVQQRWTAYMAPEYMGAVKVATVKDVQNTIKTAAVHNIPFVAIGAGHGSASALFGIKSGIQIDLGNFRYANLDAENDLVVVGGGTKFEQIWDTLYPAGKEFPTGAAPCVGTLGPTLGGGIGTLQGIRGLTLDSLVSVQLVTAKGELVTASKTENTELFWGIRGAGYNFGIVTEATYKVYDATNGGQVMNGDFKFPASANRSFFEIMKKFDHALPAELSFSTIISFNRTINKLVLSVNINYYGPMENAIPYLNPLFKLNPIESKLVMVPWNKLYTVLFFGQDSMMCLRNLHLYTSGGGLKHTDVSNFVSYFEDLDHFFRENASVGGAFVISRFSNDAVVAVGNDETAYGKRHREIKTHLIFIDVYPDDPVLDTVVDNFTKYSIDKLHKTSGFGDLTTYVNYAHGDEGPEVWYDVDNLGRLAALKRLWDPKERFSFYQPVPLYWASPSDSLGNEDL